MPTVSEQIPDLQREFVAWCGRAKAARTPHEKQAMIAEAAIIAKRLKTVARSSVDLTSPASVPATSPASVPTARTVPLDDDDDDDQADDQ